MDIITKASTIQNATMRSIYTLNNKNIGRTLCCSLHNLEAFSNNPLDLLILVLQKTECERNIIPLPLALASLQASSQLGSELFGMLVLHNIISQGTGRRSRR